MLVPMDRNFTIIEDVFSDESLRFQVDPTEYYGIEFVAVKVFEAWDTIYLNEAEATATIEGWEHKEAVKECYGSIQIEDYKELLEYGSLPLETRCVARFKTAKEALQDAEEENEELA